MCVFGISVGNPLKYGNMSMLVSQPVLRWLCVGPGCLCPLTTDVGSAGLLQQPTWHYGCCTCSSLASVCFPHARGCSDFRLSHHHPSARRVSVSRDSAAAQAGVSVLSLHQSCALNTCWGGTPFTRLTDEGWGVGVGRAERPQCKHTQICTHSQV